jgi:hypothetical protein
MPSYEERTAKEVLVDDIGDNLELSETTFAGLKKLTVEQLKEIRGKVQALNAERDIACKLLGLLTEHERQLVRERFAKHDRRTRMESVDPMELIGQPPSPSS